MIMISSNFIFNFTSFCVTISFLIKSLASVVLMLLTCLTNSLYSVLLTTSFFTTLFCLLKSNGVVPNFPISNLSTLLFKLFELVGTFLDLSISNSSTSDFKLAKSVFLAKDYVSVSFFKSAFLAQLEKST